MCTAYQSAINENMNEKISPVIKDNLHLCAVMDCPHKKLLMGPLRAELFVGLILK